MNPILNLFLPQAHKIESDSDVDELMGIYRRVTPVINDIEGLVKDLKAQNHTIFGGTGLTERGEINRGYEKYNGFLGQLDDWMRNPASAPEAYQDLPAISRGTAGLGLGRASGWADLKKQMVQYYGNQYPAWKESRSDSIGNSIAREAEERELIAVAQSELADGKLPTDLSRQGKVG